MAKSVKSTVTVSTVEIMVVDKANSALKKVQSRFPFKVKESKKLIKTLKEEVEKSGLIFVEIDTITYEKKKYEMPVEIFVTMAKEIEE